MGVNNIFAKSIRDFGAFGDLQDKRQKTCGLSDVGAQAEPHDEGVNNIFAN